MMARIGWHIFAALLLVFLLAPISLVVLFAFTNRGLTNFPIDHLSLTWWRQILANPDFAPALTTSLSISIVVALSAAAVGTLTAIGLRRLVARRAAVILAFIAVPIALPPLVLAVSLLVLFVHSGMGLGFHAVVLSQLLISVPLVTVMVHARLRSLDVTLLESARDLGATGFYTFLTITAPLTGSTLLGSTLLVFAVSLDDFVLTSFTIGNGNTLPMMVWGMLRTGATPAVNAVGTLLIAASTIMVALSLLIGRRGGQHL